MNTEPLHHPSKVLIGGPCASGDCDHETADECLAASGLTVCAHCLHIVEQAVDTDHIKLEPLRWPCPTAEQTRDVFVVIDDPPAHESGRFVELEDADGHGLGDGVGEWIERPDGWWALKIRATA